MNLDNVCEMFEFAIKYSLDRLKICVHKFIFNDLFDVLQSVHFINLSKSAVKEIVELNQETAKQEKFFKSVYKWAKNQAKEKQKLDETLDLNTVIKEELSDILPFFQFNKMNDLFFIEFVVKKSFLFSGDQLSKMLRARTKTFVKITDANGYIMKSELKCGNSESVAAVIQSINNETCRCAKFSDSYYYYWSIQRPKPSTSSELIKKNSVERYLTFDKDGDLAIKHRNDLRGDDYLLAELAAESGFKLSTSCKIEISCFA